MPDETTPTAPAKVDWWKTIESALALGSTVTAFFPPGAAVMAVLRGLTQAEPLIRDAVVKLLSKPDPTIADLMAVEATVLNFRAQIPKPSDVIAAG